MQHFPPFSHLLGRTDVITMKPENAKALVKRAQSGDADAFGELYAALRQDLFRYAYYFTSSPHLAEDAVSDCVLLAFQNIKQLKKPQSVHPWFCAILRNCCREKQAEKAQMQQTVDIDLLSLALPQDCDLESHAALHTALQKLPQDERELLLLSVLFGYSSRELAAMFGTKDGTIRARLSRTKAKLRDLLNEGDDEA